MISGTTTTTYVARPCICPSISPSWPNAPIDDLALTLYYSDTEFGPASPAKERVAALRGRCAPTPAGAAHAHATFPPCNWQLAPSPGRQARPNGALDAQFWPRRVLIGIPLPPTQIRGRHTVVKSPVALLGPPA